MMVAAAAKRGRTAVRFRWRSVSAIWWRHMLALARVWRVAITWFVIEPVVVLLAVAIGIGRLVGNVDGSTYAAFVAPGLVVGTAMFHAIFECAWSVFERIQGNIYETILTAPVTVPEVTLAELCFAVTRALISTVSVAGCAIAFGWIPIGAAPGLLLVAVGVGFVFGGIGLLFAALSPTVQALSLAFTLVASPLFFFGGVFFPIGVLPAWLQPVAWGAPLAPFVQLARAAAGGGFGTTGAACVAYALILGAALYPLAVALLRRRLLT